MNGLMVQEYGIGWLFVRQETRTLSSPWLQGPSQFRQPIRRPVGRDHNWRQKAGKRATNRVLMVGLLKRSKPVC